MSVIRLGLEQKIIGAFALALALLAGISVVSFRSVDEINEGTAWVNHTQDVLTGLANLLAAMNDAESSVQRYLLTGDEALVEAFHSAVALRDAQVRQLRQLTLDNPRQQQRLDALAPLLTERQALAKAVIELRRTQGIAAAQRRVAAGGGRQIYNRVRQFVVEMEQDERRLLQRREAESRDSARFAQRVIVGGGLFAFLLVGVMLVVVHRGFGASGRMRQSLTAASVWQRTILDSADSPIIATDPQGVIQTFNRAAERMLGYRAEEVVGKTTPGIIHDPAEVERRAVELSGELGRAIEPGFEVFVVKTRSGAPEEREWTYLRKDGSRFPVRLSVTAMFDAAGRITGFMGIATDLTERKREEERFRLVVEASPNGIVVVNEAGVITLVNARMEEVFGYTRGELVGQPVEILLPEQFRARHPAQRGSFFADAHARAMGVGRDLFGRRKDGSEFPLEIGLSPIATGEGPVVMAVVVDVTKRKQAEQALRVAMEQAQAADRLKSAFLANMSHELRTPLNSIIGFTGILLQGLAGPLNPEQAKQLGMVQGSARHLLALINDVLDISKIEAGELKVSCEPFDLQASIARVAAMVQPLAEKKGLSLSVKLAPGLGQAVSDQRRVEQVLLNLLNNAIKFTEQGEVSLSTEPNGDCVHLRVADTGMGIKPDDLATLFQPFRQLDTGLARNHEGTGLGLAICRRLAQLLGGEILAESDWGKGSSFTFTLPLKGPVTP